jgi:hypothetical protein
MSTALETTHEAIPTREGDWFSRIEITLNCFHCEENYQDRAMVWWDDRHGCWETYLTCSRCGWDYCGIPVHPRQVEEWGRLGDGWTRAEPWPDDGEDSHLQQ